MKRLLLAILAFGVSLAGTGMAAETVTVPGTGASQALLRSIASSFMDSHPGIEVRVPDSSGSGGGVKAAGEGRADLGRVARKIKDKERHYGLAYTAFASIPIVFVANPSVKGVKGLTARQAADVFAGGIMNWEALGGTGGKIRVISRYGGDSTIMAIRKALPEWWTWRLPGIQGPQ